MRLCPSCMGGSIGTPRVCAECGADLSDTPERKGTQLGGLVIERKVKLVEYIGEGAMGWVYRGLHLSLDSSVAVKLMKPTGDPDANDVNDQRFAQEARAASRLNNPHIISVMDFGRTPGGLLFIISEFLRGITLTDLLAQDGALPVGRALHITDQILTGLEEAHAAGLIHRDLKPDNIMITPLRSGEDFVKILDFGIAKLSEPGKRSRLTQQGQVIGTPTYMAPEQIRSRDVQHTADLYSLGAMLFEMLTGKPPFDSESVMEVLGMHLSSPPPRLREVAPDRDLPAALETVLIRTLSKAAADRYQSAGALRKALAAIAVEEARRGESCPTCGATVNPGGKFCPSCGASLVIRPKTLPPLPTGAGTATRATADANSRPGPLPAAPGPSSFRPPRLRQETPSASDMPATTLNRRLRVEQTHQFALLGREVELEALARFLESADTALEIVGPTGSGRTRLLREAADRAESADLVTLSVGPDLTLARRPWEPVRRAVTHLLNLSLRPSREEIAAAMDRSGLPPEDLLGLSELFDLRDPDAYVEHAVRLRETRAATLRALSVCGSVERPLVLLVDDADELDWASRSVFTELASRADGHLVKVILAAEQPLLPAQDRRHIIEPRPLSQEQISTLMESLDDSGTSTWAGRIRAIAGRSGGLPLHVVQALHLLAEGGTEVDAPLGDIVQTRVQRLPTEAMRLLQTISVIGLGTSTARVASLLGQKPERLLGALALLLKRDLVAEVAPGELEITHPRIAELVREAIPADARRRQHQALLEELRGAGEPPVALARHAAEARLGEEALQLLKAAGAQAQLALDDAGAAIHFRRALHVARWELLLDERDPICLDLSLQLGDALRYSGDFVGAQMVLQELAASSASLPATHARSLRALALLLLAKGDTQAALETIQQGVREAFFAGEPALLNQLYMDLGRVLDLTGNDDRAVQELAEGVLMVTNGDGQDAPDAPDSFWRLLALLSDLYFRRGDLHAALQTAKAALSQATRSGSRIGAARCNFMLGRCHDRLGSVEQAERYHAQALAAFRQLGDRRSAAEVLLSDAAARPSVKDALLAQAQALLTQIDWRPDADALPS